MNVILGSMFGDMKQDGRYRVISPAAMPLKRRGWARFKITIAAAGKMADYVIFVMQLISEANHENRGAYS